MPGTGCRSTRAGTKKSKKEDRLREIEEKAMRAFRERFGEEPQMLASAPGRVHLIGEYTDFNGGFVLPCAIDRRIAAAIKLTPDREGALFSADFDESHPFGAHP